jgi:hypothetical protein
MPMSASVPTGQAVIAETLEAAEAAGAQDKLAAEATAFKTDVSNRGRKCQLPNLSFRHRENRDPRGATVCLLRDRILHPTRNGDILDTADIIRNDTASDRVTEILLQQYFAVPGRRRR